MALLEIKNLSFSYAGAAKSSLKDISVEINEGELILLCGGSGSGKSTLLRHIKPAISPKGSLLGEILYNNRRLSEYDELTLASEIGYVMQNPQNQIVTDRVQSELAFGLENLGLNRGQMQARIAEMVSFFGITEWYGRDTATLSGGQMQILNLASTMVMQPRLLLLDEPTAQLDPIAAASFLEIIKKLNRDMGITIILAEHRIEEIFSFADRVVVLDRGKLICNEEKADAIHSLASCEAVTLPSAAQVFYALKKDSDMNNCPLSVREGKGFLSDIVKNPAVKSLEDIKASHGEAAFSLKNVVFRYEKNDRDILKRISLDCNCGEILSIVGANGAGKSTLLKILARLAIPYSGKIKLFGRKLSDYSSHELYHGMVSMLPQNPQSAFVGDTVGEDLRDAARIMGYTDTQAADRINEVAERLLLTELLDMHPYDLSGGEQQKAVLAKLMLMSPRVLLLDEPTKGLDAKAKAELAKILAELSGAGKCIIMVTHDVEFSAQYSNRVIMLFDGETVGEGTPKAFYSSNYFYTTASNKMSRHVFSNAVTVQDVIELCKLQKSE